MIEQCLQITGALPPGYDEMIARHRSSVAAAALSPLAAHEDRSSVRPSSSADDKWPEPIDIFGDGDPVAISAPPRNALPDVVAHFSKDVARRLGAPEAFVVGACLDAGWRHRCQMAHPTQALRHALDGTVHSLVCRRGGPGRKEIPGDRRRRCAAFKAGRRVPEIGRAEARGMARSEKRPAEKAKRLRAPNRPCDGGSSAASRWKP